MEKTRAKVLIVDLNNIWNKYLFARKGDFASTMGSVLHLFKSIYQAKEFARIYVVVDGKPTQKYEEFKDYKVNRKKNPDKYIPMKTLVSILSQYLYVIGGQTVEGDEVVGFLATHLAKKNDVYIYSNDKDFIQLMNLGAKIITLFKKGKVFDVLTEEQALAKFKNNKGEPLHEMKHVLPYRVFKGDPSDNISSACTGMRDSVIREILDKYWIFDKPFDEDTLMITIGKVPDIKVKSALAKYKNNILRNYKLMDLCNIPDSFKSNIKKIWYKLDLESVQQYVNTEELYKW